MKHDLAEWVAWNWEKLISHRMICTGTTGRIVAETLMERRGADRANSRFDITMLKSGPLGGDQQLGAMIANDEIDMLKTVDLYNTAVVGSDFDALFADVKNDSGTDGSIFLTHYAPNELRYSYSTDSERIAVFSEIYYPAGWKAWIEPAGAYGKVEDGHYQPTAEGKELELGRANWILRAAVLPAGQGEVIMRFEPESYQLGEDISRACSITLITLLVLAIGGIFYSRRRES
jgi:hypothetical protein